MKTLDTHVDKLMLLKIENIAYFFISYGYSPGSTLMTILV